MLLRQFLLYLQQVTIWENSTEMQFIAATVISYKIMGSR